jgi:hypothetical protein
VRPGKRAKLRGGGMPKARWLREKRIFAELVKNGRVEEDRKVAVKK